MGAILRTDLYKISYLVDVGPDREPAESSAVLSKADLFTFISDNLGKGVVSINAIEYVALNGAAWDRINNCEATQ